MRNFVLNFQSLVKKIKAFYKCLTIGIKSYKKICEFDGFLSKLNFKR